MPTGNASSIKAGVAAVLLASIAGDAAAWTLERADLEERNNGVVLSLKTDGAGSEIPHDVFCLENPYRVIVDLFGAEAPAPVTGETAAKGLRGFRSSLWKNDASGKIVRYVLETNGPVEFQARPDGALLTIEIHTPSVLPPAVQDPASASYVEEHLMTTSALLAQAIPVVDPAPFVPLEAPSEQDLAPLVPDVDPRASKPEPFTRHAKSVLAQSESAPSDGRKPMNLDVHDADLRTVFRSISEFSGVNIAADRDVAGPITLRLVQTPWRDALDVVCRASNLVAVDVDGVIRVATAKAFRDEGLERESAARKQEDLLPLETRMYTVNYANAKELRASIAPALSPRGLSEIDQRTNSLIVKDIAVRLNEVDELIVKLDAETRQVAILAQLIDLDDTASEQLGIMWDLANLHSNSERVSGSAHVDEPLTGASSGQLKVGVVRDWGNFTATLEAFQRDNRANIVSNPKITTTNNRPAKILVGKEIPLIVLDERGNPVIELKKVGITLEVTPYINSDKKITMDLHPEVSDLSSQATVTGGLIFTTAQADTRVMVNNGETAIIGGLIRTNETKFQQGVPILKSLPFIGSLFRYSDTRNEKRELVILVTPTIVESMATR